MNYKYKNAMLKQTVGLVLFFCLSELTKFWTRAYKCKVVPYTNLNHTSKEITTLKYKNSKSARHEKATRRMSEHMKAKHAGS